MWRSILAFFIFLFLLTFPTLANQDEAEILPFAYVQHTLESPYNLFVMNATSREIVYSNELEDYFDCPLYYSNNREWLLHGSFEHKTLLNLLTLETFELAEGTQLPTWSEDAHFLAYYIQISNTIAPNTLGVNLYVEDLRTGTRHYVEAVPNILAIRFIGVDLLYVYVNEVSIILARWNGSEITHTSFERPASNSIHITISPNGQFLEISHLDTGLSIRYLLNTLTGEKTRIPSGMIIWRPSYSASFAHIAQDGTVSLYDATIGSIQILSSEPRNYFSIFEWSPDGRYLAASLYTYGGTDLSSVDILLLDTETQSLEQLYIRSISDEWDMEWLSPTQFVYTYSNPRNTGVLYYDIYLYDVVTREDTQLTFTPDLNEQLSCIW